jgi:hypothetical protein
MSAQTHYNRFIGHDATLFATTLAAAPIEPTLTITARDAPYYFQRIHDLYPSSATGVDPYSDITVNDWRMLTITPAMIDAEGTIEQELLFLIALGLAMRSSGAADVFYIDPRATDLFYDNDGLFRVGASHTVAERMFRGYMRDVVLPGYILSYRHHTEGLPDSIYRPREGAALIQQINEALAEF